MPQSQIITFGELEEGLILVPERYDPRRFRQVQKGRSILEIITIEREMVDKNRANPEMKYVILDTGDAQEGFIRLPHLSSTADEIGSSKKRMEPGDVIISRLRPYLKQVALVDRGVCPDPSLCHILGSAEFFVLRSRDGNSIAFLVPFLLSNRIQGVLSASQEGGHHPRFNQDTLERLIVPEAILSRRNEVSQKVESAANSARIATSSIRNMIRSIDTEEDPNT